MKVRDVASFGVRMLPNSRRTRVLLSVSLALNISLLLLPFIFKFDGKPHADWQQFLGRFHPLTVHLPIGLLVLLPILEVMEAHGLLFVKLRSLSWGSALRVASALRHWGTSWHLEAVKLQWA